jgi:nucleotide-binding universal stress UspA family protein
METFSVNETHTINEMLVLTDFSKEAANAAVYATALAHQLNTRRLILYHSYESIAIPPTAFAPYTGGFTESHELSLQKITELKDELKDWLPEKAQIDVRCDERNLVNAVISIAGEQHIGLVVMGISGKSGLERTLMGSNTINVAHDTPAPLLIVPPVASFQPIKTVVFACDLKRVTESTPVLAMKSFIAALGARLIILNVDHDGAHFNPDTIKEMKYLHQLWDEQQPEYHYTDHEDRAKGIMEFAGQQRAELVITVPKQYGFFESIFHRSMTKKLAYHTHLPLLLFKEDA